MDPQTNTTPTADSNNSSDECLAQVLGSSKLRIMCSYGGHIVPRLHDKSLCYVGGETRMVVIDRQSSLSSLSVRLSHSLLNGRHFTLKYQLPNEDLDSLISVSTDEDLENMVEEYDRITSNLSPLKPSRLRVFLFLAKPETAASMGSLFNDAKSENWFMDALNGSGLLPRGLSDSAVADCQLLEILPQTDIETGFINNNDDNNKHVKSLEELHTTMPDSPLVETGSSFGSSSSSPSMSNLPPIKVKVDDSGVKFRKQIAGLDEQFSQIGIGTSTQKQDDEPVLDNTILQLSANYTDQNVIRVVTDDERLENGVPTSFRKPPLPLQVQRKLNIDAHNLPSPDSKGVGGLNFSSADSVASDSSTGSVISVPKHPDHQEPAEISMGEYTAAPVIVPLVKTHDPNNQVQVQQVHEQMYLTPPQNIQQQQHYVHSGIQFMHQHPTTGQAPISSYYPVYAPPQQLHQQIDQSHYPMYVSVLPVSSQNQVHQPYNYPIQANIADSTVMAPPQNNNIATQPFYATNRPEIGRNVYTNANNFQQQYGNSYGYEYSHPPNEQLYYTQRPVEPQHQTLTAATAVMFQQASAQLPKENSDQQIKTSQPL